MWKQLGVYLLGAASAVCVSPLFRRRRACDIADELLEDPEINAAVLAELKEEYIQFYVQFREDLSRVARVKKKKKIEQDSK